MKSSTDFIGMDYVTVREMAAYIRRHPLDTQQNSHQLLRQLEREMEGNINLSTLVLAALFNDYIVVPSAGSFKFMRL